MTNNFIDEDKDRVVNVDHTHNPKIGDTMWHSGYEADIAVIDDKMLLMVADDNKEIEKIIYIDSIEDALPSLGDYAYSKRLFKVGASI
jgi:hypothetical protein